MLWQKNITLIPTKFVRNYNIILGAIQECLSGKILRLSNIVLSVIAINFQRNWGACVKKLYTGSNIICPLMQYFWGRLGSLNGPGLVC